MTVRRVIIDIPDLEDWLQITSKKTGRKLSFLPQSEKCASVESFSSDDGDAASQQAYVPEATSAPDRSVVSCRFM